MPSIKELYEKLQDVKIDADSINLNTDGLESLLATTQADIATIKDDLADGVAVNGSVDSNIESNNWESIGGSIAQGLSGTPLPVTISGTPEVFTGLDQPLTNDQLRISPVEVDVVSISGSMEVKGRDADNTLRSLPIATFGNEMPNQGVPIAYLKYDVGATCVSDINGLPVSGTLNSKLQDGSGNALTSSARGSQRALSVQIVDGSGNQVTSFGSATVDSNLRDGSGNAITSTVYGSTRRLDVILSSGGATGSATPTNANLVGGTDGTSLRGLSVDSSGRPNVNVNGTVPVSGTFWQATQPVSGSVTALSSTGNITTRSSTITTGGTSQQVAASNSSRKYFVIQNISDTAMYLGIGYTPTTTTGLLLSANGGGIVFETSFIPTQAINVLCATTGKAFVAWEG